MLRDWALSQADYLWFCCGLAGLLLGAICLAFRSSGVGRGPAWNWLAAFGLLFGAYSWLEALAQADLEPHRLVQAILPALSCAALLEFGRRGVARDAKTWLPAWVTPAALAVAWSGWAAGPDGFAAAWRYALALPGGLLAARTLLIASRLLTDKGRGGLAAAGIALGSWGVVTGLIVPRAGFIPASVLNDQSLAAATGLSVLVLQVPCVVLASWALWSYVRAVTVVRDRSLAVLGGLAPWGFTAIVVLSWLVGDLRGDLVDQQIRDDAQRQSTAIASTLTADLARRLTFTAADKDNPAYRLTSRQMRAYGRATGLRCIYSLAIRGSAIVFGPESLLPGDPLSSPPGTVYKMPPAATWSVFRSGQPAVVGPVADEYGTFITGLAPVVDSGAGEVLMLVGVDIIADQWRVSVARSRLPPMAATLLLVAIVVAAMAALGARQRLEPDRQGRLRHTETVVTAAVGLALTATLVAGLHDAGVRQEVRSLAAVAEAVGRRPATNIEGMRDAIVDVTRYLESSDSVSRDEFRWFTAPVLGSFACLYGWAPRVPAHRRASFEAAVRGQGIAGFEIRKLDWSGRPVRAADRPVYYPITYLEPARDGSPFIGMDLMSDPVSRAAVEEAIRTQAPAIRGPVALETKRSALRVNLLCTPAMGRDGRQPSGCLVLALPISGMLDRALAANVRDQPGLEVDLLDITGPGDLTVLGSSAGRAGTRLQAPLRAPLTTVFPVFAHGRAHAVLLRAGPGYYRDDPLSGPNVALVLGLLLSAAVTALVGFLRSRQQYAEQQVVERTRALQESEDRLASIFHAVSEAVLLYDPGSDTIIDVNDRLLEIFGYPREQALRLSLADLCAAPPDVVLARAGPQAQRALASERVIAEWELKDSSGRTFWGEVSTTAARIAGRPCIIATMRDITERRQAEAERAKLEDQLRQARKMEAVGQLAGGIAHDFNNILQAISGHAELALQRVGPEGPAADRLRHIDEAAERAAVLVSQLLAFSRRQIMKPEPLDPNEVIATLLKMLGSLIGEHIRLDFVPGHGLGTIHADRGMLEQVLMNLCVNARDAMPDGGTLTIETEDVVLDESHAETHPGARPGRYALITVTDSGCGMDAETLERAFEPFFTTKEVGRGTGLGLATVYGIVHQHDELIYIYSEKGVGTSFKVYLPSAEQVAAPARRRAEESVAGGKETILIAEDDEMVRNLAAEVLTDAGYSVLTANDGAQALAVLQDRGHAVDLMLLDVVMPHMGGKAVMEHAARLGLSIPTLFSSGYSADSVHTGFVLHEGLRLVRKPYRPADLLRRVRQTLDSAGGGPGDRGTRG